ncbi:hypothetical protein JKP88DRAFT_248183 [Tribonema minus]|uniref:Uncharacterized protein n=1 Tax=Tribonema minus TaxID=303371 RepID=A0A836CBM5_9STRA|nr:hypothetical protein JKP88DRAFT_248183 [Tribonema minus]
MCQAPSLVPTTAAASTATSKRKVRFAPDSSSSSSASRPSSFSGMAPTTTVHQQEQHHQEQQQQPLRKRRRLTLECVDDMLSGFFTSITEAATALPRNEKKVSTGMPAEGKEGTAIRRRSASSTSRRHQASPRHLGGALESALASSISADFGLMLLAMEADKERSARRSAACMCPSVALAGVSMTASAAVACSA